eukprot:4966817-Pleurochrysis_carterae.AAC.2
MVHHRVVDHELLLPARNGAVDSRLVLRRDALLRLVEDALQRLRVGLKVGVLRRQCVEARLCASCARRVLPRRRLLCRDLLQPPRHTKVVHPAL